MRAPLRIRRHVTPAVGGGEPSPGPLDPLRGWLERLVKLVPSEIIAVYLAGRGYAGRIPEWWPLICLALLVIVRVWGTRERPRGPQWIAVGVSAVSFVVWVLAVGGRFPGFTLPPDVAALVALVWATLAPVVYRGD
jgi:hypothetical protein